MSFEKSTLIIAAFAVPVLCCLIGIGAFVLLTIPPTQPPGKSYSGTIEKIKEQENIAKALKDRLNQVNEQIRQLYDKLQKEKTRAEVTRKVKETIAHLESFASNLKKELLSLHKKLAEVQIHARKLEAIRSGKEKVKPPRKHLRLQEILKRAQELQVQLLKPINVDRSPTYRKQEA